LILVENACRPAAKNRKDDVFALAINTWHGVGDDRHAHEPGVCSTHIEPRFKTLVDGVGLR
jgi:hypothetical protein